MDSANTDIVTFAATAAAALAFHWWRASRSSSSVADESNYKVSTPWWIKVRQQLTAMFIQLNSLLMLFVSSCSDNRELANGCRTMKRQPWNLHVQLCLPQATLLQSPSCVPSLLAMKKRLWWV